ncbi:MAG: D-glycero-beta-D-manno-heptose 1,7-bisphosphate 7-phosphatase [Cyclobacteriaceae bacterium]
MRRKALFLDRDGVINEDKNYVHRIEDFVFIKGVFSLLRKAQELGYLLIVVTNQAGIARGYYHEEDFHQLTRWMKQEMMKEGIFLDHVYFCPYHPQHGLGSYKRQSSCRKPAPGMILQAEKDYAIDLSASMLIGDKESDIEAGLAAGVGTTCLLLHDLPALPQPSNATHTIHHLKDALSII